MAGAIFLCACTRAEAEPVEDVTVDPYAGMVQVESGMGTLMWAELYEDLPLNMLAAEDFYAGDGLVHYTGGEYTALRGIDVSEHQLEIDWQAVAQSGVNFAMIRAGYRGFSEGGLFEDAYFRQNIEGAISNGIEAGIYFFSQATTVEEAKEEAEFLLELLKDYEISFPVAFDWENIGTEPARTDNVGSGVLTDCAVAFCEKVKAAGYDAAVYLYRYTGYYLYELPKLGDYILWVGAIGDYPDFYYRHDIWQYSVTGTVDGIETEVDLNLAFFPDRSGDGESDEPETSDEPEPETE